MIGGVLVILNRLNSGWAGRGCEGRSGERGGGETHGFGVRDVEVGGLKLEMVRVHGGPFLAGRGVGDQSEGRLRRAGGNAGSSKVRFCWACELHAVQWLTRDGRDGSSDSLRLLCSIRKHGVSREETVETVFRVRWCGPPP